MSYKKTETIQQHQENKKFNRVETVKKELNRNYRTEECSKRNGEKSAIESISRGRDQAEKRICAVKDRSFEIV